MCCGKVISMFDEVREFVEATQMTWDEDKWLRKLIKAQRRGLGLAQTMNKTFNDLRVFYGEL